jgi:ABC-type nitrate/sulfonate/bicarbonate transport system substrate-binding protein
MVGACGTSGSSASRSSTTTAGATSTTPYPPKPLKAHASITVVSPPPGEFNAGLAVAAKADEFAKENLTVKIVTTDPTSALALAANGQAQIVSSGLSSAQITAMLQGVPIVWVGTTFQGTSTDEGFWLSSKYIKSDGKLDTQKFLADKTTIGVLGGATGLAAYAAYGYFKQYGLSAAKGDYTVQPFGTTGDLVVALQRGSIAGAYLTSPFYVSFQQDGTAKWVATDYVVPPDKKGVVYGPPQPIFGGVWLATRSFLKSQPDVAAAFFRAIARTDATYLQGNYKAGPNVDLIASALNQPTAQFTAASGVFVFQPNMPFLAPAAVDSLTQFWLLVGALKPNGGTQFTFNPAKYIDHSPIDTALK